MMIGQRFLSSRSEVHEVIDVNDDASQLKCIEDSTKRIAIFKLDRVSGKYFERTASDNILNAELSKSDVFFIGRDILEEDTAHVYTAEASQINWWNPGLLPKSVKTDVGNGQNLVLISHSQCCFTYKQMYGCITVHIFNT